MWTYQPTTTNELYHHGIKGQKWGVRRFQNEDGSLTEDGKIRYRDLKKEYESDYYNKRDEIYKNRIEEMSKKATPARKEKITAWKQANAEAAQKAVDDFVKKHGDETASAFMKRYVGTEIAKTLAVSLGSGFAAGGLMYLIVNASS